MNFHVGQEVECISETYRAGSAPADGLVAIPRKGRSYTVRGFHPSGNLFLVEIVNAPQDWLTGQHEFAFHPSRFRPLVRTDICVFTAMLALTPKQKEVA